jgi:hypothetical protein
VLLALVSFDPLPLGSEPLSSLFHVAFARSNLHTGATTALLWPASGCCLVVINNGPAIHPRVLMDCGACHFTGWQPTFGASMQDEE